MSQSLPEQPNRIPTDDEVLAYLDTIEPGKFPLPVFNALAKRLTQATVELVPVRTTEDGKTEVLLTQRAPGDPWEYEWHVPGTILLASDTPKHAHDYSQPFERLLGSNGELKSGVRALSHPTEVDTERRVTRRGPELSVIHWVEVEGEPIVGRFFDIDGFPNNVPEPGVIEHHQDFIPRAVEHYLATKEKA